MEPSTERIRSSNIASGVFSSLRNEAASDRQKLEAARKKRIQAAAELGSTATVRPSLEPAVEMRQSTLLQQPELVADAPETPLMQRTEDSES